MKARTDCVACRKRIYSEAEAEFMKHQYAVFKDTIYSAACFAVCGVLSAFIKRGRSKQYIKQIYDDMCLTFSVSNIFGKEITMTEIMTILENEYGVDWKKINVNIETEKQFIKELKK